ncbi:MAG: phosphate ABC transporter permease PstA [Eubacteriales bacterium]|nr:phosphate ABC transporter permease PstA [Bacillota bacterium]MBV1728069.1 phosphate ABC transporter permease PstA [Desulforudis sp.]MDQ7788657.1 phosphate ABC transporter permease PstA [Clostridia bacterium]MDZ4043565.1 phosphate ABC transporter permease PstA [Eubacteriales bacterium]MBU4532507.1 phosphate ABC transporter permease PstA [Bacillota bacterium]
MQRRSLRIEETLVKAFIYFSVICVVFALFNILWHILSHGVGLITWEFISSYPRDMGRAGGILPSIVGTACLVALAVAVAAPIGILTATYLAEYAGKSGVMRAVRFSIDTLAGVPSIVFGLFGFAFLVIFCGFRWSILSGGLTLAFMILPVIVRTSEEAIKSVPYEYRECSLALGATKWQTVARVVLPAAAPGIVTGIILGIGRSVGETAAIMLTAGSSLGLPTSIMDPVRSLSLHLYILVSEGVSFEMGYATASVLIILIFCVNLITNLLVRYMITKRMGAGAH